MLKSVVSAKVKMINVRLTPEVHDAFKIACELRGVSMSSFLHQTVVKAIREEKEREPQAFDTQASLSHWIFMLTSCLKLYCLRIE